MPVIALRCGHSASATVKIFHVLLTCDKIISCNDLTYGMSYSESIDAKSRTPTLRNHQSCDKFDLPREEGLGTKCYH